MSFNPVLHYNALFQDPMIHDWRYLVDSFFRWHDIGDFKRVNELLQKRPLSESQALSLWGAMQPISFFNAEPIALLLINGYPPPNEQCASETRETINIDGILRAKLGDVLWAQIERTLSKVINRVDTAPEAIQATAIPLEIGRFTFENANIPDFYQLAKNAQTATEKQTPYRNSELDSLRLLRGCAAVYFSYFNDGNCFLDFAWSRIKTPEPGHLFLCTNMQTVEHNALSEALDTVLSQYGIYSTTPGLESSAFPGLLKVNIRFGDPLTQLQKEDIAPLLAFFNEMTGLDRQIKLAICAALQSHPANDNPTDIPADVVKYVKLRQFRID